MHTDDAHFHTRFLLFQWGWFGALVLYLFVTLVATAWERTAEDAGDQAWPVPAFFVASAGVLLAALAVRHVRTGRER